MLFNHCCPIVLCKYDFVRCITLNDHSLVAFIVAATSINLTKGMACDNNDFMPRGNFCKYEQTVDNVILLPFSVAD